MSHHVKVKVLKWDIYQVDKMFKQGDSKVGEEMMQEGAKFMPTSLMPV